MFHAFGNNPIKYVDPDGRATIVYLPYDFFNNSDEGVYGVRSQDLLEIAIFDKVLPSFYTAGSGFFNKLMYKSGGEYKIPDENKPSAISVTLTCISILGDMKLSKSLEAAGSSANAIKWFNVGVDIFNAWNSDLEKFAIESFVCSVFQGELQSPSIQVTEKLYNYAKKEASNLVYCSRLEIQHDVLGNMITYTVSDPVDLDVIANDLNNYKRRLLYGLNDE